MAIHSHCRIPVLTYSQVTSGNNLDTTYDEVSSATGADINYVHAYNPGTVPVSLSLGQSGSEVVQVLLPPGISEMPFSAPKGSRIAVKTPSAVSSGTFVLNFFQ
jgi:hypothetical protein